MSILSVLSGLVSSTTPYMKAVGTAAQAVGAVTSFMGSQATERALETQAGAIENLNAREREFILEQSQLESDLIEARGRDEAEILQYNEQVAIENSQWAQRAGDIAMAQAKTKWENQVKDVIARLAASGTRLSGTNLDVIAEQVGEMEKDLYNIGLNTQRAVKGATDQAELYSLRRKQTERLTAKQAETRLSLGEIEADIAGTEAASRAAAARTQARTAGITGYAGLFRSGGSLLSSIAEMA